MSARAPRDDASDPAARSMRQDSARYGRLTPPSQSTGAKVEISMTVERARLALARPDLLREAAFVDGEWIDGGTPTDLARAKGEA